MLRAVDPFTSLQGTFVQFLPLRITPLAGEIQGKIDKAGRGKGMLWAVHAFIDCDGTPMQQFCFGMTPLFAEILG